VKGEKMAKDLVIKFGSEEASQHFAVWLCESGEQHYWDWMRAREEEEPGNITAVNLEYYPDDSREGFVSDGVIRAHLGRLGE
jgi:2-succinyl-5-enolpyruvyl-6-hydroxy-3-cyclohexene-1-carboxylate synthase